MIRKILMEGIKNAGGAQELTGRDIIIGGNGTGKTTRAQALGIALLGYAPGNGKLPSETMKLASGDAMTVGLETDGFKFTRTFKRVGDKVEQSVKLVPPNGEKTLEAKNRRIEEELGRAPVMLDFQEFLGLSDMKRREFVFSLLGTDGQEDGTETYRAQAQATLAARLAATGAANPRRQEEIAAAVEECAASWPDGAVVREGLEAMLEYAKDQASYWKKEREKAFGASQKMAEYKNGIEATDRSLAAHRQELDALGAELQEIAAELAEAESANRQAEARAARVQALNDAIAELESARHDGGAETAAAIEQYRAKMAHVDNSAAIEAASGDYEAAQKLAASLDAEMLRLRDAYAAAKAALAASKELHGKLSDMDGSCAIDSGIKCGKDFTEAIAKTAAEIDARGAAVAAVAKEGSATKARLEAARDAAQEAQDEIGRLRAEEMGALKSNEELRKIISGMEEELRRIEGAEAAKEGRLAAMRGEMESLGAAGAPMAALADTAGIQARREEKERARRDLAALTDEETKARNALAALKSAMADGELAEARFEIWKAVAEAVGPKGLQGEIVKDTLSPLATSAYVKLAAMGVDKKFYFQTEDEKGKEVFQFGWEGADGRPQNFDALSTGEQMLLLAALMAAIIEMLPLPLRALVIDNAEGLDRGNIKRALDGLAAAGDGLDNIIFSGVMDIRPEDAPGWRVWDLGGGAA